MNRFLVFILFVSAPLFGLRIDQNSSSFSQKPPKKVEVYDFAGEYPHLEDVDIDAKRKMHVELLLSGNYPLLKKINFDGGFGTIKGVITGQFPSLEAIDIVCTKAELDVDLNAHLEKNCLINISGTGNITVNLPKDKGIFLTIKTATPFEKIVNHHPSLYKRKGILNKKIFLTPLADPENCTRPLTVNIVSYKGLVTLK